MKEKGDEEKTREGEKKEEGEGKEERKRREEEKNLSGIRTRTFCMRGHCSNHQCHHLRLVVVRTIANLDFHDLSVASLTALAQPITRTEDLLNTRCIYKEYLIQ